MSETFNGSSRERRFMIGQITQTRITRKLPMPFFRRSHYHNESLNFTRCHSLQSIRSQLSSVKDVEPKVERIMGGGFIKREPVSSITINPPLENRAEAGNIKQEQSFSSDTNICPENKFVPVIIKQEPVSKVDSNQSPENKFVPVTIKEEPSSPTTLSSSLKHKRDDLEAAEVNSDLIHKKIKTEKI